MTMRRPSNVGPDAVQDTTLTGIHLDCREFVVSFGLRFMDEESFPPFHVDIYMPELHGAVEADGPSHNKKRDEERDAHIFSVYGLRIFRIAQGADFTALRSEFEAFMDKCDEDVDDRLNLYTDWQMAQDMRHG